MSKPKKIIKLDLQTPRETCLPSGDGPYQVEKYISFLGITVLSDGGTIMI